MKALGTMFLWMVCLGVLVVSVAAVLALACLAFLAIVG
jgi:hypothetical protein